MKNIFKKIFCRKKKDQAACDNLQHLLEMFQFQNESQIKKAEKLLNELKFRNPTTSDDFNIIEFFETGLDMGKAKHAERVVNEYGAVLHNASENNKKIMDEFFQNIKKPDFDRSFLTNRLKYQLMNKFDKKLLPYRKEQIKEAIEFMLRDEKDNDRAEILKAGLLFLDDFIDIDDLENNGSK